MAAFRSRSVAATIRTSIRIVCGSSCPLDDSVRGPPLGIPVSHWRAGCIDGLHRPSPKIEDTPMQKLHITVAAALLGMPLLAQELTATLRLHATPKQAIGSNDEIDAAETGTLKA